MAMKEKILKYLKHDRSHAGGVKLYNELGTRISLKRQLNVQPEDAYLTSVLHEELRVIAGITMDQFRPIMMNPVIAETKEIPQGNPPMPADNVPAETKRVKNASVKISSKGKKKPASIKKPADNVPAETKRVKNASVKISSKGKKKPASIKKPAAKPDPEATEKK
jgi:hypothetical protein